MKCAGQMLSTILLHLATRNLNYPTTFPDMRIDHAVLHISCLIKFELSKTFPDMRIDHAVLHISYLIKYGLSNNIHDVGIDHAVIPQ